MDLPPGTPECVIEAVRAGRLVVTSSVGTRPAEPPAPSPPGRKRPAGGRGRPEYEFQEWVIAQARRNGWAVVMIRPVRVQRKDGSVYYQTPFGADGVGFPDLVLVRDRVVYAELKDRYRKRKPAQDRWAERLLAAGQEVYLWRPKDRPDIERVLA